ncbi:hypothetical protein ACHAXR_006980 [Thalassiosira sp. AJA248-18]
MADVGSSAVRLRSIYVSRLPSPTGDAEAQSGPPGLNVAGDVAQAAAVGDAFANQPFNGDHAADEKDAKDPLQLPESTHSLLFTEGGASLPFWFAIGIVFISFSCLWLAFQNNLTSGSGDTPFNVPANVSTSVRVAQYLSIFIALLMEEEIPTGLFLLRQIQYPDFRKKLPTKKYGKFFCASILRIFSGYFFLINVFLILIQANGVIEIFYDVLALQFVQQLDDIAFSLAKIDVLGKRLQRACTSSVFETQFEKIKVECKKSNAFLKALYFLNLGVLLAGMITVSTRQISGYYQCNSITVNFGDEVWDPAFALNTTSGEYEEWTLLFSYFSGVYVKNGTHASRPIYREMRKFDRKNYDPEEVVPAEIRYCEEVGAWIFTHEHIRKTRDEKVLQLCPTLSVLTLFPLIQYYHLQINAFKSGCNWLLRSPDTDEYDLRYVDGDWSIWTGVVGKTEVSIACNTCSDNVDCNLNGQCVDGECKCYNNAGCLAAATKSSQAQYLGMHCETRLSDSCQTVIGEQDSPVFSIKYYSSSPNGDGPLDTLFQEYSRPVYSYISSGNPKTAPDEDEVIWMMYTGSRWFGMYFNLMGMNATEQELIQATGDFHGEFYVCFLLFFCVLVQFTETSFLTNQTAFWHRAYSFFTVYVSDPTKSSTPGA